jgi:hypothetical protein
MHNLPVYDNTALSRPSPASANWPAIRPSAPPPRRAAEIAGDDRRRVAVARKPLQGAGHGALEGEIALPQAERQLVARQFGGRPFDGKSFARRDLFREQPLGDAQIEAAVAQAIRQSGGAGDYARGD